MWKFLKKVLRGFKGLLGGSYLDQSSGGASRSLGRSLQKVRGTKKSEGDPDLKK